MNPFSHLYTNVGVASSVTSVAVPPGRKNRRIAAGFSYDTADVCAGRLRLLKAGSIVRELTFRLGLQMVDEAGPPARARRVATGDGTPASGNDWVPQWWSAHELQTGYFAESGIAGCGLINGATGAWLDLGPVDCDRMELTVGGGTGAGTTDMAVGILSTELP